MKILLVTSRCPWPPRRGDQLRALQHLELLSTRHRVTLLTPEPGAPAQPPSAPLPASVQVETYRRRTAAPVLGLPRILAQGLPLQNSLFCQPDLAKRLKHLAPSHDVVVLQLVRLAGYLECVGEVPVVADLVDSLALNLELRARFDRPWLSPLLKAEARRLATWERRFLERSALGLVVSERDYRELIHRLPTDAGKRLRVAHLWIAAKPRPNPANGGGPASTNGRPVLTMTGNLGYFPNRDAVGWWLQAVWPQIRRRRPDVRLVVAGDRPSRSLRRALRRGGAELVPSPRDLASVLSQATLALAPLRCGSGVPVKILEAWSVHTPVVASPWAAAGVTGSPGEELAVAETPHDWVGTILDLLDDTAARRRLAESGHRRLLLDYSAEGVRAGLLEALESVPR